MEGIESKIITLCGSTRYKETFLRVSRELTLKGYIVLSPDVFSYYDNIILTPEQIETLKKVHLDKISMSDLVMVINVNGYVGKGTEVEIEYAKSLGKQVIMMQ